MGNKVYQEKRAIENNWEKRLRTQRLKQQGHGFTGLHQVLCVRTTTFSWVLWWDSWMSRWPAVLFLCLPVGLFYFSVVLACPTSIWWFSFYLSYVLFPNASSSPPRSLFFLVRDRKSGSKWDRRGGTGWMRRRSSVQIILCEKRTCVCWKGVK